MRVGSAPPGGTIAAISRAASGEGGATLSVAAGSQGSGENVPVSAEWGTQVEV